MLILISDPFDPSLPNKLAPFGEVTTDQGRLPEAEIVLVRSKTKVTKEYIEKAKRLKLVIRGGVGMDTIDIDACQARQIEATNTADASSIAVAELAFAMLLALPNHLVRADNAVKAGQFPKAELTRTELHGKTLGILGFGRIGTAIAVRARAFHMRVMAFSPIINYSDFAQLTLTIDDLLAQADFLSLNLPLTPETRGIINKAALAKMKPSAYIINTGRGEVVVEQDIADALQGGRIAGYATDVFASEPPSGSPLITAPNTLLIPHLGASTKENMHRIGVIVEKLVSDYVAAKRG